MRSKSIGQYQLWEATLSAITLLASTVKRLAYSYKLTLANHQRVPTSLRSFMKKRKSNSRVKLIKERRALSWREVESMSRREVPLEMLANMDT